VVEGFFICTELMEENTWKVVYIASRQEKKVAKQLERDGIAYYLPLQKRLQQWSDRKKWVEFPLFNGYLFVRPDSFQRDKVLELNGVVAYVRYNGADAIVRDEEIEIIQRLLQSGYALESQHSPEDFEKGATVMVIDGPLKGQRGEIIRRNDQEMFLIGFETLGQSIKVELPFQVLKK